MESPDDASTARAGTVYLVGAGPGDPGLLTLRGRELLGAADVVLHDELIHPDVLRHCRAGAEIRYVGKRGDNPNEKQAKQSEIDRALVTEARRGRVVVRLKGGDPFLFGRGSEEARALALAGVPFEVVPGVSSPIGAAAYAGISLTHRDFASSVTFVSGTTRAGDSFDWSELASVRGTVCVFMGMRRVADIARGLMTAAGRSPSTPVAIIQWGTWSKQRVVVGTLSDIAERVKAAGLGSPGLIVVGEAVGVREHLRWFDRLPLFGRRVLVTRAEGQAQETASLLLRRGAEPVALPTIAFRPPPDPAPLSEALGALREPGYDVVAFTSANGVDWFWRALDADGKDARVLGRAAVAAIGVGTARALAARGVRADLVPERFVGEELAQVIEDHLSRRTAGRPARVLILRALVARDVLPASLRAAGHTVDVVPVYETVPVAPGSEAQLVAELERGAIDVVLVTSSSTVDRLCDMIGSRAPALLGPVTVGSIGPITTAAAAARGLAVAVTAERSTIPGLVDAVERHFAARGEGAGGEIIRTEP